MKTTGEPAQTVRFVGATLITVSAAGALARNRNSARNARLPRIRLWSGALHNDLQRRTVRFGDPAKTTFLVLIIGRVLIRAGFPSGVLALALCSWVCTIRLTAGPSHTRNQRSVKFVLRSALRSWIITMRSGLKREAGIKL